MIEARCLKNVVIFIQTILSFVLSKKKLITLLNLQYTTNNVSFYIVYGLDNWPKTLLRKSKLKSCFVVQLIWQKTVMKVSICHCVKSFQIRSYFWSLYPVFGHFSRSVYSGYDGKVSWSFGNDLASYIVIFSVDNTSSSHIYGGENDI